MEVTLIRENPDGSASYTFDMTDDERLQLLNLGIITALKLGIEEGKKYDDSQASMGDTGSGEVSCKDGTGEQSCESGQCSHCPEAPKVSDQK